MLLQNLVEEGVGEQFICWCGIGIDLPFFHHHCHLLRKMNKYKLSRKFYNAELTCDQALIRFEYVLNTH